MEADEAFADQLDRWRNTPWAELREQLDETITYEIEGPDDARYQFEVLVRWDDPIIETLHVIVSGDDGHGWKAVGLRTVDFIKASDDSFVGE